MPSDVVDLDESPPGSPPGTPLTRESINPGRPIVARIPYQRPPIRDFALAAFQKEEHLPTLIAALREHDNQPRIFRFLNPDNRITEWSLRRLSSAPDLSHVTSEAGDSERTIRGRKQEDAAQADSGSETERDEPGRVLTRMRRSATPSPEGVRRVDEVEAGGDVAKGEDVGPAKKKSKKKNKKKKKKAETSEGKKDDAEVEELLDDEALSDTTEHANRDGTFETTEDVDIELEGVSERLHRKLQMVDESEQGQSVDETAHEDSELGDVSSSTIDNTLLVTPHIASGVLPHIGTADDIIDLGAEVAAADECRSTKVVVRLPSPTGPGEAQTVAEVSAEGYIESGTPLSAHKDVNGNPDVDDRGEEEVGREAQKALAPAQAGQGSAETDADRRLVGSPLSIDASLPLTDSPRQDPPSITSTPQVSTHNDLAGMSGRSSSPPPFSFLDFVQPPTVDIDEVRPLRRSWTLHHSFTGATTPSIHTGVLNGTNAIASALGRQAAADYSDGLFKLFTARTVQDFFGSWKALRRKIAFKHGRRIEPYACPPLPGHHGLGVAVLPDDTNFHFFIEHVKPMWEDEACKRGGKIMITGHADNMDQLFFELILALIGEQFVEAVPTPPDTTCTVVGVVLSKRRSTCRIEIWLGGREPLDPTWIKRIEHFVRDSFPGQNIFEYKAFHSSARPPARPRRDPNGPRSFSAGATMFSRGMGNAIGSDGR